MAIENSKNSKRKNFEALCRQSGLKVTPQRAAVYMALSETDTHPTAEAVYNEVRKEMPNISLDTVNRTLHTLSEIGAAFVVEGTGQPRRFDGGEVDHQHFLCVKCGRIVDFSCEKLSQLELPEKFSKNFKILRKKVYLEGICDTCVEKENQ